MCDTEETIGGADLPITEERARWRHVSVCVTASFLLVGFLDLDFFVPLDDGGGGNFPTSKPRTTITVAADVY